MKKKMCRGSVLVAFLLCNLSSWGQVIDATTGYNTGPIVHGTTKPLDDPSRTSYILWDTHHGVYLDYEPTGRYSDLKSLLTSKNQLIEVTNTGILNLDLGDYNTLVLSLGSCWGSPYSPEEANRIYEYVLGGGNLLLLSDNYLTPNQNLALVASRFGVTFSDQALLPSYLTVTDFNNWPTFEGVDTLELSWAGALDPGPFMISGARAPSGETVLCAGKFGGGNVIVIGDINFCSNAILAEADNQRFTENLFDSLTVVTVPTLSAWALAALVCGLFFAAFLLRKAGRVRRMQH